MKLANNAFAALLISDPAMSTAAGPLKGSDLTSVTHGRDAGHVNPFGRVAGKQYSRGDISVVGNQGSATKSRKPGTASRFSDITAVTDN